MSNTVIQVEKLSKLYHIGGRFERYRTLRETIIDVFKTPFKLLKYKKRSSPKREIIWALKDISFEVMNGEAIGIIGRNGAGKTTLLKILSRITEPTEGYARINGRVGSLLEVGTGFHQELTGRENIYLNGAILGMRRAEIERKFDEIVAFSGIEKFIDTPVKHYSSGMYVRLAFAVAAHLEPDILLVDEVLAVGDALFQKKCLGKMEDVTKEGRTVLFVSHNMGAISSLCKKGLVLSQGQVDFLGDVDSAVKHYLLLCEALADNSKKEFRRPRKDCTGRVTIESVEVEVPTKFAEPLVIAIYYKVNEPVERFSVEWVVSDIYGQRIMSGLSALSDSIWFAPRVGQRGQLISRVKHWRLTGGRYSLSVLLTIPLVECMDYVENISHFQIVDMSPGNSGFTLSRLYGYFLPEVAWEAGENTILLEDKG